MVGGITYFKCPCCGKIFKGPDIELAATVYTQPLPCPSCGAESPSIGPLGWFGALMQKMRKSRDN